MVDLRGCLSDPLVRQSVIATYEAVTQGVEEMTISHHAAVRRDRQLKVRDRLSEANIPELVDRFVGGTTREALAEYYGISLSSVKRLLREQGARRCGRQVAPGRKLSAKIREEVAEPGAVTGRHRRW